MYRRRRDAIRRLRTNRFGPMWILAILILFFSLFSATESFEIQIHGISPTVRPALPHEEEPQFSLRKTVANDTDTDRLCPYEVIDRLDAAATFRSNLLTAIGRILLLPLDEESRIAFERVHDALRTRYVPAYDYLSLIPIIHGKTSGEQLHSVLRLMEKISTPYISSYAMLCLEAMSDGRMNVESILPMDLSLGIDNDTRNSLVVDLRRNFEVPLTFDEAISTVMADIAKDRIEPSLEIVAAIMLNLPNFDLRNPEVPESMKYVADYMKQSSEPDDPIFEYLSGDQMSRANKLVEVVLKRILISGESSLTLREAVGLLLQNFGELENRVEFRTWNATRLFDIVVPDFYPRSVVAVVKYLQKNFNRVVDPPIFDLSLYTTELQALGGVVAQLYKNPSLPENLKDIAASLGSFIAEKQREEDPSSSIDEVNVDRALEYLEAFRNPCLPRKVRAAAQTLRPYLNDKLPWNYALGDIRLNSNPYELLLNGLINLKNIKMSDKLGRALDNFIYHVQSAGITGKRTIIYERGIIFQREDSDEVEIDVYSLLARLPNVFHDKRFAPLLTFFSKPNLLDYLGHGFNMFVHTSPRDLLYNLITKASGKPAVKADEELYKALKMSEAILEEPTLGNTYGSDEELKSILKILPGIDVDPRYLPIKLLFDEEHLFEHISPTFSLAGLKRPDQHIAIILNTVTLKPIHKRLEEAIIFALTNLEGPQQLPIRTFNRDDFAYLVNHFFRHDKSIEIAILKSPIYKTVSDWNIAVSGTPEDVLARTLTYPIEKLSKRPKFSAIIKKAEKILEKGSSPEMKPLDKKTLDEMLNYLPDTSDLGGVTLLLRKANLAKFLPKLNMSSLGNDQPRESLIILLEHLMSSLSLQRELVLKKSLHAVLKSVKKSAHPPAHDVSSVATELLLDPSAPKYKPLRTVFRKLNSNSTLEDNRVMLEQFLFRLEKTSGDMKIGRAAKLALKEVRRGADSGMIQSIKDTEIHEALSHLPKDPRIDPLKKLLTESWILDILPRDFQSSEYPNKKQVLGIILFMTKQKPEVIENPALMSAISLAEDSLVGWKQDVESLRKIVSALKETLYHPVRELLKPHILNKLGLNLSFAVRKSPKQMLVGLLQNLMQHPKITGDSQMLQVLDGLRQDVLNFGLDSDLLWVMDDAGIPYTPDLSRVRLFLHTKTSSSRLGPLVNQADGNEERYEALMNSLSNDKYVRANQDLSKSVDELRKLKPSFKNDLEVTKTDIMDIVEALPEEVIAEYPDVQELFTQETLDELTRHPEIVESPRPFLTLLLTLGRMSKVLKNPELGVKVFELHEALGDALYEPVISGYKLRPLLRELDHAQQMNIDYILQIIDGRILSALLPEGLDHHVDVHDDSKRLNNILNELLAQGVLDADSEFKRHVISLQRDLMMSSGRKDGENKLPSDQEVEVMLEFIPNSTEFHAIRHLVERKEAFGPVSQSFDWGKYPTPLKKLIRILNLVERDSRNDDYLHDSVLALSAHLLRNYFFISDDNVQMLLGTLNELSVEHGLVPLRLFFTVENLISYLPSDLNIGGFESPKKALIVILHILRDNEKLKGNESLQNSIAEAIAAVEKSDPSRNKNLRQHEKRTASIRLRKYDLRFILNLKTPSPGLKNYLDPGRLVKVLPKSFSFASKPTFKAKVLHLLKYLVSNELGPVKDIEETIRRVNSLSDLPNINSTDVELLFAAIDESAANVDFHMVKKYLTLRKLVNFIPGNFNIRSNTDMKETLVSLVRTVLYSLSSTEKREIVEFEKLLKELQKPSSSMMKRNVNVKPAEVKSLIEEIPFERCEKIGPLREDLEEYAVLKMLPMNLNLTLFKTRKLKLLEILKHLKDHPNASNFSELVERAEKCVAEMQEVPKLSDRDIRQILTSSDLDEDKLNVLLENCRASDLAEYLPIAFDIREIKSYKSKFEVVIKNCKKVRFKDVTMKIALKKAKVFVKKLPSADITNDELNRIFNEICCFNFTSMKPLMVSVAENSLRSLLPLTLNFDKESTVKQKLLSLLNALRNLAEFKNEKMSIAVDTAEAIARGLPNKPAVSQRDIDNLKKLPVMMDRRVSPFNRIFVLSNLMKIVPPSFNISGHGTESSKLMWLLKYSENMNLVKTNDNYAASLRVAVDELLRKAEKETLEHLRHMVKDIDEHIPLMLYVEGNKDSFFDDIKIPHGFEYPKIEDRLRVVLKHMVSTQEVARSKSLVESIDSVISKLSIGQPTDYEISEAVNGIPDSKENRNLKIYLDCQDVRKQANRLSLTHEHTAERILLDLLTAVKNTTVDEEMTADIERTIADVQRTVWNMEIEQLFKQIPSLSVHREKLEAVRLYYILHGPEEIFGANYRKVLPGKLETLKKLVGVLLASPDLAKNVDLETGVVYLNEILTNPSNSTIPQQHRITMQDIDIKSLFPVLPKIRSEKLILGLLKFFSDPELTTIMSKSVDPSQFKSQGSLMREIVKFGLKLDRVKNDPAQLTALEYVEDKILMTDSGALPIKLNTLSKREEIKPDLIGLLKSIDFRTANLSDVMPIAKFFDTDYNPLIHGRGFDHRAHTTRGTYLKALLQHLISNPDVQQDIKKRAKILINHVRLYGPGAQPVDVNEDTVEDSRVFHYESLPDQPQVRLLSAIHFQREYPLYTSNGTDVYSHFRRSQDPDNHRQQVSAMNVTLGLEPTPNSLEKFMENDVGTSPLLEEERIALNASVNRILNSDPEAQSTLTKTKNGTTTDSDESDSTEYEGDENKWPLELVEKQKTLKDGIKKTLGYVKRILPEFNEVKESETHLISPSNKSRIIKRESRQGFATSQSNDETSSDPESATFSPDKVLVDVETRINEASLNRPAFEEAAYVTEEEVLKLEQKKHHPIRPLTVDPAHLPAETDTEYEMIPHTVSKSPERVDLISRKLFIRNDTDGYLRDLSEYISSEDRKNLSQGNKTVKKDLSRAFNDEHSQPGSLLAKNDLTDLLPAPEALTLRHSAPTESATTQNESKFGSEKPASGNRTTAPRSNGSNGESKDDITVENFKADQLQNATIENSVQVRKNLDNDQAVPKSITSDNDDHLKHSPSSEDAVINEEESPHAGNLSDIITEAGPDHYGTRRKADKNFHQPHPKIGKMHGDGFRRKRLAEDDVPMISIPE